VSPRCSPLFVQHGFCWRTGLITSDVGPPFLLNSLWDWSFRGPWFKRNRVDIALHLPPFPRSFSTSSTLCPLIHRSAFISPHTPPINTPVSQSNKRSNTVSIQIMAAYGLSSSHSPRFDSKSFQHRLRPIPATILCQKTLGAPQLHFTPQMFFLVSAQVLAAPSPDYDLFPPPILPLRNRGRGVSKKSRSYPTKIKVTSQPEERSFATCSCSTRRLLSPSVLFYSHYSWRGGKFPR